MYNKETGCIVSEGAMQFILPDGTEKISIPSVSANPIHERNIFKEQEKELYTFWEKIILKRPSSIQSEERFNTYIISKSTNNSYRFTSFDKYGPVYDHHFMNFEDLFKEVKQWKGIIEVIY